MNSHFHTVEMSDAVYEQEGLRTVTVKSRALGGRGDVSIWVPEAEEIGTLLILLHGVYGSHWVWSQKAGVHRTAQRLLAAGEIVPMVIVMPSDGLVRDGSGYLTDRYGQDTERWIVDEVPEIAHLAAPALRKDAKVSIGGFSMGGYGALRLGAKYPDRFSTISAHSSITNFSELQSFIEEPLNRYLDWGPPEELGVIHWMCKHRDQLPPIRFDCGIEDNLAPANRTLHRELDRAGIAHEYAEFSGAHDWTYWREHVEETLRFVSRAGRPVMENK